MKGQFYEIGIEYENRLFFQTDIAEWVCSAWAAGRGANACASSIGAYNSSAVTEQSANSQWCESGAAARAAHDDSWRLEVQPGRERRPEQEEARVQRDEWGLWWRTRPDGRRISRRWLRRLRQTGWRKRRRTAEDARTLHAGESDHAFDDRRGSRFGG